MSYQSLVWALGGESHCAPENTLPAYWGTLGAGADGLAVDVRLTADGVVVCCEEDMLEKTCGDSGSVSGITAAELRELDAGRVFRSIRLNEMNQVVGQGDDQPWSGEKKRKEQMLYHPSLAEVLLQFSRRTQLLLRLRPDRKSDRARQALAKAVADLLVRYGTDRATIIACDEKTVPAVKSLLPDTPCALVPASVTEPIAVVSAAKNMYIPYVMLDAEAIISVKGKVVPGFVKSLGRNMRVLVTSRKMPYALTPMYLEALRDKAWVAGILCRAVHETLDAARPLCCVLADDFQGKVVDKSIWDVGYSKENEDTRIFQDNGLIIDIKAGGEYSGAAALTAFSIRGDFDARVCFHVENPHQGTTFELAAIQVDPGYRDINLTFDVHGAPPYASSERDENDGFRIGWNNGPALTKFVMESLELKQTGATYSVKRMRDEAQSSNLYNEYSRDVGDGKKSNQKGKLRLVRTGSVFNAYYTDQHNEQWVLCGSALVATLSNDVFLRLGAKHWPKRGKTPPPNKITFNNFELYQRRI